MSVSIEYQHQPWGEGVALVFSANVSSDELLQATTNIADSEQASTLQYRVVDLNAVDSLEISAEKLQALARGDKDLLALNPDLKFAFICQHQVVQSVVQMWCTYIDQCEQRVRQFSSLELAQSWLALQADPESPAADRVDS